LYVDPFTHGDVLSRDACRERIVESVGRGEMVVRDKDFRPATPPEIAIRVLRNLKTAYALRNQWEPMLPVQRRLMLLLPFSKEERRDLGLVYLRTGRPKRALPILENYLKECSQAQAAEVKPYLRSARRMVVEMN
jgi:regulator of sirC expression with transglutaminase-like and TPR domain